MTVIYEAFDRWQSGHCNQENNGISLVMEMRQMQVAVVVDGWTTSEDNYVKVYTPYLKNEVGESQRHNGIWESGKYWVSNTSGATIYIGQEFTEVDGLQVDVAQGTGNRYGINSGMDVIRSDNYQRLYIRNSNTPILTIRRGIHLEGSGKIYNTIIYDFKSGANEYQGINPRVWDGNESWIFNITIQNCGTGIYKMAQSYSAC